MTSSMNGNRLTYWIIGALFSVLLLGGGGVASWVNARLTDVEQTQRQRGDRVIYLEAKIESVEAALKRIEDKLDSVLRGRRAQGSGRGEGS